MDIIKPNNENRTFEYYTLKNNIKCIFINDDTLDKSYIVASVNVGSLANKEYYEGMAHLLEHMCFITSKKYKEKNYLNRMVSEAGGSTNAFTDEQNTIYYLDMFTDKLEEILEIFIDFLTNAELKEEYILAEIKSVNSEHKKNIHDDQWRFMNLEKMLADKNNNYNGFYTGSTETLNKPDIYEKILDFYNKYYISNNISICIASNKSIKDIKKIANPHLSSIPKSTKILNKYLIKPIYNSNIGKTFQMKAEGEIKLLAYKFETPNGIYNSKIFNLLTNILNSPEENLCSDHLKSLGYITFFSAEYDDLNGLFIIRIYLSKNGLKNIIYINSFIEYAINQILLFDWKKIFDYNKIKYNFLFNNLNKIDTLDLCIDLLTKMTILGYTVDQIYYADYNLIKINEKDINILKKYIDFKNCIRIIVSKNFKHTNFLVDKNYQTKYVELKDFFYNIKLPKINIVYDLSNSYSKIKPKKILNLNNQFPILIEKRIWYKGTSEFNEPVIYCKIIFNNEKYFNSPENYLITTISIIILNYYLSKELYKAVEFNYGVRFSSKPNINSIELSFSMYNDIAFVQLFIDNVLDLIKNKIIVSDELIKSIISDVTDNIKNIVIDSPWNFCEVNFNLFYDNSYNYTKLLSAINNIDLVMIKSFLKNIIKNSGTTIFIFGNIDKNNLPSFNKISNNINNLSYKFSDIKIKKNITIKHPNSNEISNCIKISYFIGQFNPLINLTMLFIVLMSSGSFFDNLRTDKQLGYLVQMNSSIIGSEYYIYQKIQSELSCDKIIKHINIFNKTLIKKIKEQDLNKWKITITNHLTEKAQNIGELFKENYSEILFKTYLFDRNKIMLKYIDEINIEIICDFINNKILNNKKINIINIVGSKYN